MIGRRGLIVGGALALGAPAIIGRASAFPGGAPPVSPPRTQLGQGKPRINWSHPLAQGLIGCYVPGWCGNTIYNLVGIGGDLVVQSGAAYANTQDGRALDSSASNSLAFVTAPPTMQPAVGSAFWRGNLKAAVSVSNIDLMGLTFTNSDTTPFDAFTIGWSSGSQLFGSGNIGGAQANATQAATVTTPSGMINVGMTIAPSDNTRLYVNGVQTATAATGAGTISYGTPQICLGGYAPVATRIANAQSVVGYLWKRTLTAGEMLALHFAPYAFLIFPDDDLLRPALP